MKTQHTPTPWQKAYNVILDKNGTTIAVIMSKSVKYMDEYDSANAAHIVKCVNLHDELALELENYIDLAITRACEVQGVSFFEDLSPLAKERIQNLKDLLKRAKGGE